MYVARLSGAISFLVAAALVGCGEEKPLGDKPPILGGGDTSATNEAKEPTAEDLGGKPVGDNKPTSNVVLGCYDGDYAETLPDLAVSIDDLTSSYDSLGGEEFVLQSMERRYPTGKFIVEGAQDVDFCKGFLTGTGQGVEADLSGLSTSVHECGHMYDILKIEKDFEESGYFFNENLTLTCQGAGGDSTTSADNTVVGRGVILTDVYQPLHPACADGDMGECDGYAPEYLAGDDGKYGFDLLMEETLQYTHSLAVSYAMSDKLNHASRVSERDGLLNFFWYVERYLKKTREEHPDDYAFIVGNECWRKMILSVWGRGWLYLEATKDMKFLGIDDAKLMGLVQDPDLMNEIQLVRKADSCVQ